MDVPADCPELASGQLHSTEFKSIEGDLITRASHTHGLFRDDSAEVYYKLEEDTRSTSFADSIKPFHRSKDGRAPFRDLMDQCAGLDKW